MCWPAWPTSTIGFGNNTVPVVAVACHDDAAQMKCFEKNIALRKPT